MDADALILGGVRAWEAGLEAAEVVRGCGGAWVARKGVSGAWVVLPRRARWRGGAPVRSRWCGACGIGTGVVVVDGTKGIVEEGFVDEVVIEMEADTEDETIGVTEKVIGKGEEVGGKESDTEV